MSVENLVSSDKLTRDRALEAIAVKIPERNAVELKSMLETVYLLEEENQRWEVHLGKLEAATILLQAKVSFDILECEKWNAVVVRNLDNCESRVRQAAAKLAGQLVRVAGLQLYDFFRHLAVEKLKLFMIRDDNEHLIETDEPKTSDVVLHDTAGWRSLESYMLLLQEIMTASVERGESANDEMQVESEETPVVVDVGVDKELIRLVCEASAHRNRFVREMSHRVIESIVAMMDLNSKCRDGRSESVSDDDDDVVRTLCCLIAKGLSDNWSQVRMSASIVTRTFCTSLTAANLDKFLSILLPPMCLNRYYIAEGVRIYSQESWKRVFGDKGRQLVAQNMQHVIAFYISQSEAENHAVREAVCACITELVLKIEKEALQPHVSTLLQVLFLCFDDDSWPVRDSACVATGYFVEAFPSECSGVSEDILQYLYINLRDNIPSVREGAASSLNRFLIAYSDTYLDKIIQDTHKGLEAVSEQEQMSTLNDNLDKGPATYSVAKQLHDNDASLHENQIMYSCGSLAPKMRKGSHNRNSPQDGNGITEQQNGVEGLKKPRDTGGCSGHSFRRPGQPWEITDGFVLFLGELSSVESFRKYFNESLLLLFSNIFKYKHFTHHTKLFTTCYKVLSTMFTNLGKMATKRFLEFFLEGLLYGLSVDNKLAQCAAQDCFIVVSNLIGPNILRGRVESFDPRKNKSKNPIERNMTLLDYYRNISSICSKNLKLALYGKSSLGVQNEIYSFLATHPAFVDKPVRKDKSLSEFRRETHVRTKALFDSKLMTYEKMLTDINNYIEFNTCVGMYDWSCLAKFVLSWQFVGLTTYLLGTEQHEKMRADIENMNIFGSFSITELTHGSNLKGVQTTATYDPKSKCFILNTPSVEAVKCWTGNLACTATHSVVFAQLHTKGQNRGVHMFLVPVRNPRTLLPLPGVLIGDMGEKLGLHGVDNGFMALRNVKIPKHFLFNRLSDVADDGTFQSQFKDNDSRLSASLGTLLMGRVAIVGISVANMRCALSIALRFSAQRRQFYLEGSTSANGAGGGNKEKTCRKTGDKSDVLSADGVKEETSVLEYPTQQLRLIPNLAKFFVYDRFSRQLFQYFHQNFLSLVKKGVVTECTDEKQDSNLGRHLHVVSCGAKAVVTSCAQQVIQTCREACGGYGILASSNLGKLREDNDPQLTYEGDNYVLIQQLINYLITNYKKHGKVVLFNVVIDGTDDVKQVGGSAFDTLENQQHCLNEVVKLLLRMKDRNETSKLALGNAVINFVAFHWYKEWLANVPKGNERDFLENVLQLFAVEILHENAAYLLSCGVLKVDANKSLHELQVKLEALCIRLKNDSIMAVDAIAPPDFILNSSIGQSEGELHENVLQDMFAYSMQSSQEDSRPDWWKQATTMMGQSNSNM